MNRKEIALTICAPIVFAILGLVPYFYQRLTGAEVPMWIIKAGLSVGILAASVLIYLLTEWLVKKTTTTSERPKLVSVAVTCVLGASCIVLVWSGFRQLQVPSQPCDLTKYQSDRNETISRHSYLNETVVIDGKTFDQCNFTNVTLMFHGTAPASFIKVTMRGQILLKTDNVAARGFEEFGAMIRNGKNMKYIGTGDLDPSGTIHMIDRAPNKK